MLPEGWPTRSNAVPSRSGFRTFASPAVDSCAVVVAKSQHRLGRWCVVYLKSPAWLDDRGAEANDCAYRVPNRQNEAVRPFDRLSGQLNERQQKALLRMFNEDPEGFKGGLSAGKYSKITGASPATTTRDLADLTEKGARIREGERRHAGYL
jgi:hypothetical protein